MSDMPVPDSITLEFFRSNGDPLRLLDLGVDFLNANHIDSTRYANPFRVAIEKRPSKAGNTYYEYSQNSIPLPDGLSTFLKIYGSVIPLGAVRPSQKGYPTREGQTQVLLGATLYNVIAYLTEGKSGFYVKVVAHKRPETSKNIAKAQMAPRGGNII